MTDSKSEIQPGSGSAAAGHFPDSDMSPSAAGRKQAGRRGRGALWLGCLVLLLLVVALGAALWHVHNESRLEVQALAEQVSKQSDAARQAGRSAQDALAVAQAQAAQTRQLQQALEETQDDVRELEQALQWLTDGSSDIALLNEVDHLVTLAHQQLSLAGSVSSAVVALETAQGRLAKAGRPALAPLQQAINGDLDRLRAVSTIDVGQVSGRIDELAKLAARAPLLVPDAAAPQPEPLSSSQAAAAAVQPPAQAEQADVPWWKTGLAQGRIWLDQAWTSSREELGRFISVRRVDDDSALLLSPDQASQLRDGLRLRLMTAQLALLMRQADVWETETRYVAQMLRSRYDLQSADGQRAMRLADQLADTSLRVALPTVDNSRQAIEALRAQEAEASSAQEPQSSEPSVQDEGASATLSGARISPAAMLGGLVPTRG